MNNYRRKEIMKLEHHLEVLSMNFSEDYLRTCIDKLEDIKSEEEDAFYNMPENLQSSSRGMESEEAIDMLEEALGYLEEILDQEDEDEIDENIMAAMSCLEDIC